MKKIFLALFLFSCAFVKAQNPIPNFSFEDWSDFGNYSDPDGWQSDNYATADFGIITTLQDTLPTDGTSNVSLTTKGDSLTTTIPSVLCSGTFNDVKLRCEGGFPITQPYDFFNGYAWYKPTYDDKAVIAAYQYKYNNITGKRDTISVAYLAEENTNGGYAFFSIPFISLGFGIPDSALIILTSTVNVGQNPPQGSKLRVDNIELSNFTGMDDIENIPVNVYPNPANDRVVFQMQPTQMRYTLAIYDIMGRRFINAELQTNHIQVSTSSFNEGVFFYEMRDVSGKVMSTGSFEIQH